MRYESLREVVGAKWALHILESLDAESPQNYSSIESSLPTSSDVVAARLDVLVDYGLISRKERSKKDVRYSITETGETFLAVARELDSILAPSD